MSEFVRLSDVNAIIDERLQKIKESDRKRLTTAELNLNVVRKMVNDLDVFEVVRCKDCKWCHAGYCEKYDDLIPFGCANKPWDEWFCADGEKENG